MERQCRKCQVMFTPSARHLRQHRFVCRSCESDMERARTGAKKRQPLSAANFIERCAPIPVTGCWLWAGSWNQDGYGVLRRGNRKAHRLSYEIHKGAIPDGLFVCHRCHVPACVNPDHLYAGTHQQNMLDRRGRPRRNKPVDVRA